MFSEFEGGWTKLRRVKRALENTGATVLKTCNVAWTQLLVVPILPVWVFSKPNAL